MISQALSCRGGPSVPGTWLWMTQGEEWCLPGCWGPVEGVPLDRKSSLSGTLQAKPSADLESAGPQEGAGSPWAEGI